MALIIYIYCTIITDHHDDTPTDSNTSSVEPIYERNIRQRENGRGGGGSSSDLSLPDLPSFQARKQDLINAARKYVK